MFLWFKDWNYFYRGALPTLIVLEKMDSKAYTKEEIRLRDEMTTEFEEDNKVHGKWQVCDFVRNPDVFRYGEYNAGFPREKLYFKWIYFGEKGNCKVQYGEEIWSSPNVDWTRGFVREWKSQLMQSYERRIINGTEFLFVEFKSGDYFYNRQKPWWYVFTRIIEND